MRRAAAHRAAHLSVWADGRLLGIPEVRTELVERAVRMAMGAPVAAEDDVLPHLCPENRSVALQACYEAQRAALTAIAVQSNLHECKNHR